MGEARMTEQRPRCCGQSFRGSGIQERFSVSRGRDGRKVSDRERAAIVRLCQESDSRRGIWKRIDENRELMELLATETQFMKKFPYAAVWIAKTDAFLSALAEIVRPVNLFEGSGRQFPRPWPYEDARQLRDQLQNDFVTRAFGW